MLLCIACGSDGTDSSSSDNSSNTEIIAPDNSANPLTPPPGGEAPAEVTIAAGPDGVVYHYICVDKCEGGNGPGQAPCPVCGKTMAHNKAFHNQTPTAAPSGAEAAPLGTNPSTTTTFTPPPATPGAEPAQNAAGVWHYICPKGCSGGGGSAVACSSCATTLVHNSAYHQ